MARSAAGDFRFKKPSISGESQPDGNHRPGTPEHCFHRQAAQRYPFFARAGDDGLRHGELYRAERDGEHSDDVQNSVKRSVLRRAEQAADQDVEEEIKPVNPRRGDHEGPATVA